MLEIEEAKAEQIEWKFRDLAFDLGWIPSKNFFLLVRKPSRVQNKNITMIGYTGR